MTALYRGGGGGGGEEEGRDGVACHFWVYHYLTVENVVWCIFLKFEVPHENNTIWVVRDVWVSEIAH